MLSCTEEGTGIQKNKSYILGDALGKPSAIGSKSHLLPCSETNIQDKDESLAKEVASLLKSLLEEDRF